jgi:hypothetical protein
MVNCEASIKVLVHMGIDWICMARAGTVDNGCLALASAHLASVSGNIVTNIDFGEGFGD